MKKLRSKGDCGKNAENWNWKLELETGTGNWNWKMAGATAILECLVVLMVQSATRQREQR
jgi:hypothetical protein